MRRSDRSAAIFHDEETGAAPVGAITKTVSVDERIDRMQRCGPVGAGVDQFLGLRRDETDRGFHRRACRHSGRWRRSDGFKMKGGMWDGVWSSWGDRDRRPRSAL